MSGWSFVIAAVIGAICGALVTAVVLLDHEPLDKDKRRKWWE